MIMMIRFGQAPFNFVPLLVAVGKGKLGLGDADRLVLKKDDRPQRSDG